MRASSRGPRCVVGRLHQQARLAPRLFEQLRFVGVGERKHPVGGAFRCRGVSASMRACIPTASARFAPTIAQVRAVSISSRAAAARRRCSVANASNVASSSGSAFNQSASRAVRATAAAVPVRLRWRATRASRCGRACCCHSSMTSFVVSSPARVAQTPATVRRPTPDPRARAATVCSSDRRPSNVASAAR